MKVSGTIELSENAIVYNTATIGNSFELPMANLKAVFKYHHQEDSKGYIFVNDAYARRHVPIATTGLTAFLEELATVLSIPKEKFEFTVTREAATRIYLKPSLKNYQVLPTAYAQDQNEGYEIIGGKSVFCKWNTTIDELKKQGLLEVTPIGSSGQKITISYPVRIGNLLIDGLEIASSNQRKDYPIRSFYANIINVENTENSLFEAYACLKLGEGKRSKQSEQISKDRIQIQLSIADIHYRFSYLFSGTHQLDLGYSTLLIENERVYYDRLRTFSQYATIQLTTCCFFKEEVNIYNQLNNNQLIGITPQGLGIQQDQRALIWVDEKQGIIGFTQKEYSYIFELGKIDHFSISNTRPARGSGSAVLVVVFKADQEAVGSWTLFEGRYQSFDKSVAVLEAMSAVPVAFLPERMND
jgi:hypothetical protein